MLVRHAKPYYQPCTVIIKITVVNYSSVKGSVLPLSERDRRGSAECGATWEIKNGVFTPGGAGANPFVVPLIAAASIKYPHMFINHNQQVSFKAYAEKIVMKEVTPLFNKGTMPTPQQFQLTIENIANKHLQNAS